MPKKAISKEQKKEPEQNGDLDVEMPGSLLYDVISCFTGLFENGYVEFGKTLKTRIIDNMHDALIIDGVSCESLGIKVNSQGELRFNSTEILKSFPDLKDIAIVHVTAGEGKLSKICDISNERIGISFKPPAKGVIKVWEVRNPPLVQNGDWISPIYDNERSSTGKTEKSKVKLNMSFAAFSQILRTMKDVDVSYVEIDLTEEVPLALSGHVDGSSLRSIGRQINCEVVRKVPLKFMLRDCTEFIRGLGKAISINYTSNSDYVVFTGDNKFGMFFFCTIFQGEQN